MNKHSSERQTYYDTRHRYGKQFQFTSFSEFFDAVGPRPQGMILRRHDPAKPFSRSNCFWGKHDVSAANKAKRTHGLSRTRTYESYAGAKKRTSNPRCDCYDRYGAFGIRMLFGSFSEFFAELGVRPAGKSLDRLNPFAGYQHGNVAWKDARWQKLNQRSSPLNILYWAIHETLLDEGMSPVEASAQCQPIPQIERMKQLAIVGT